MKRAACSRMSLKHSLAFLVLAAISVFAADVPPGNWYKGNLHTHTLNSDGDSTPSEVASWYRENGYHFLVLSDHNYLTETAGLNAVHGAKEKFLLIAGEEVTASLAGKPIHLNAYNPDRLVEPVVGTTAADTIRKNISAIRKANGLPSINHPNFHWALTAEDLLQVGDLTLFELYNGHPMVNNRGGGGFQSLDEIWDTMLTAGKRIFGVAVDDAHHFKVFGRGMSNPGRGWVVVRAPSLTTENIVRALADGDFYASTGVELLEVRITREEYRVRIKPHPPVRQTTWFIGARGEILARSFDNDAVYRIRAGEKYVRARVESSTGDNAWTQPYFSGRSGN